MEERETNPGFSLVIITLNTGEKKLNYACKAAKTQQRYYARYQIDFHGYLLPPRSVCCGEAQLQICKLDS